MSVFKAKGGKKEGGTEEGRKEERKEVRKSPVSACLSGGQKLSQSPHNKIPLMSHCPKLGTFPPEQKEGSIGKKDGK